MGLILGEMENRNKRCPFAQDAKTRKSRDDRQAMASTTVLVHWERKKVKDVLFGRAGVFFLVEEGWLPGYEVQLLPERILLRSTSSISILIGSDPSSKVSQYRFIRNFKFI